MTDNGYLQEFVHYYFVNQPYSFHELEYLNLQQMGDRQSKREAKDTTCSSLAV